MSSRWVKTPQAAEHIGQTAGTLKKWRSQGRGPTFYALSRRAVVYALDDLDAWISAHEVKPDSSATPPSPSRKSAA